MLQSIPEHLLTRNFDKNRNKKGKLKSKNSCFKISIFIVYNNLCTLTEQQETSMKNPF